MSLPQLEQPCPMCGEHMPLKSVVCRNCGERVTDLNAFSDTGHDLLRRFRNQTRWLTAFWMIGGTALMAVSMFTADGDIFYPRVSWLRTNSWLMPGWELGILMLAIGFAIFRKQRWGLYLGLIVSYGLLGVSFVYSNLLVALGIAAMQLQTFLTIRTIRKARQLSSLDIPLDTKL